MIELPPLNERYNSINWLFDDDLDTQYHLKRQKETNQLAFNCIAMLHEIVITDGSLNLIIRLKNK